MLRKDRFVLLVQTGALAYVREYMRGYDAAVACTEAASRVKGTDLTDGIREGRTMLTMVMEFLRWQMGIPLGSNGEPAPVPAWYSGEEPDMRGD